MRASNRSASAISDSLEGFVQAVYGKLPYKASRAFPEAIPERFGK
jgi:hypothetical protein